MILKMKSRELHVTRAIFNLPFTTQSRLLTPMEKKPFENIVRKGENAGNQHFLLFSQCFLPVPRKISVLKLHLFCCLQMLSIWTSLKICHMIKSSV